MATPAQWLEGARPRTLPAAVAPVLAGTGVAVHADSAEWWKAALAMVVSLALQVAVNFANDYSDGIRGTDADRVGPLRLVGSGVATAAAVKGAALAAFAVAAVAGLILAAVTSWWLLLVGAGAIAAAWYYTGGARPYGYRGLGEVSVFVFFGLVAVLGTVFVQTEDLTAAAVWAGCGIGALACAILVANNLRDIPTDEATGKQTLAVLMGDRGSRELYAGLHAAAYAFLVLLAMAESWWALLALAAVPLSLRGLAVVRSGARGPALIPVLRDTGLTELVYAVGILAGMLVAAGN